MPVKDSPVTTVEAIEALLSSPGIDLTVYNDFSTQENTAMLADMAAGRGFELHNWADHTDHPSPNYRLTLIDAQRRALSDGAHLVIVESDVTVSPGTLGLMASAVRPGVGMVAAVTVDETGSVNFPYLYASRMSGGTVATTRRLSFCCTLLSNELLRAFDFSQLDPSKQWFDVAISHRSRQLGFTNLLQLDNAVLHRPHSSRPWKRMKYTSPLRYYIQKIFQRRDRI